MFKYEKKLAYPINISKKNLKMARYIISGLGGKFSSSPIGSSDSGK